MTLPKVSFAAYFCHCEELLKIDSSEVYKTHQIFKLQCSLTMTMTK